jgi:hypothetical protein
MKRKILFYTVFAMSLLGCSTYEIKELCKDIGDGNVACVMIKEKK